MSEYIQNTSNNPSLNRELLTTHDAITTDNSFKITKDDTAALLVEKKDGTDVFNVDTSTGTVTISGALNVLGSTTTITSTNLAITDPLIKLADGNLADVVDINFYGQYNDGTTRYAGLFRDATDKIFKLFKNLTVDPTTNVVDTGDVSFKTADLQINSLQLNGTTFGTDGHIQFYDNAGNPTSKIYPSTGNALNIKANSAVGLEGTSCQIATASGTRLDVQDSKITASVSISSIDAYGFNFTSSPLTGMTYLGANNFALTNAGAQTMHVYSGNLVGIGGAPFHTLHAHGTIKSGLSTAPATGSVVVGDGGSSDQNNAMYRCDNTGNGLTGNFLGLGGYEGIMFMTGTSVLGTKTRMMYMDTTDIRMEKPLVATTVSSTGLTLNSGTQLTTYTEASHSTTFSIIAATSASITIKLTRVGRVVHISTFANILITADSAGGQASALANTAIPATYRPSSDISSINMVQWRNNSITDGIANMGLTSAGIISFAPSLNTNGFNRDGTQNQIFGFEGTYDV